jgi:hypothetical protein
MGGTSDQRNLLGAHAWCNHFRRSMPPDLAAQAIRARLDNPQTDVERYIAGLATVAYMPPMPVPAWEEQGRKPTRAELLTLLGKQRRARFLRRR